MKVREENGDVEPTRQMPVIHALARGLRVLEQLAADAQDGASVTGVTELADALGLHKSTALRLLLTLERCGYVEQDEVTRGFRLRWKLFELGSALLMRGDLVREARPVLERLAQTTGEVVHLSVLDDGEVVYVDKVDTPATIRMYSRVGRKSPVHCTGVGKAILAFLSPAEVDRIVATKGLRKYTERTLTRREDLEADLARIRETGVAFDDEEHEVGIRCVAAPIRNHLGQAVASLSVAGPAFRMTEERQRALADPVSRLSRTISERLGFNPEAVQAKSKYWEGATRP